MNCAREGASTETAGKDFIRLVSAPGIFGKTARGGRIGKDVVE